MDNLKIKVCYPDESKLKNGKEMPDIDWIKEMSITEFVHFYYGLIKKKKDPVVYIQETI